MKLNTLINRSKIYGIDLKYLIRNVSDEVLLKLWLVLSEGERQRLIREFKRDSFDLDLMPAQPPSDTNMKNTLITVYHMRDNWTVYYFGAVILECCPYQYIDAATWLLEAELSIIYQNVYLLTTTAYTPVLPEDFYDLINSYSVKLELEVNAPITRKIIILLQNFSQNGYTRIGESTIPGIGMGLFADTFFKEGMFISDYGGVYGNQASSSDSKYVVNPSLIDDDDEFRGLVLDGNFGFYMNELGRWVNDSLNPKLVNAALIIENVESGIFGIDNYPFNVYIQATRDIQPGEEIFASYGDDYWKHSPVEPKKRRLCVECQVNESLFFDTLKPKNVFCSSKCFNNHNK